MKCFVNSFIWSRDQKLMEINDPYIIYLLQNIQLKQKDLQFATDFGAQTSTALAEEIS